MTARAPGRAFARAVTAVTVVAAFAVLATSAGPARAAGRPVVERPTIAFGGNGVVGGVTQAGWPLVVSAVLVPGVDSTGAPVAPAPPALTVRLLDARGAVVPLALEAVGSQEKDEVITQWSWLATESATRSLALGNYRVTADTTGLTKTFRFVPGALAVEGPRPGFDRRAALVRMERSALLGRFDEALAETDRMIAADSTDAGAWTARGDLWMSKAKPEQALEAYERADAERDPKIEALEPARRRSAAFNRMLQQRGVLPAPSEGK